MTQHVPHQSTPSPPPFIEHYPMYATNFHQLEPRSFWLPTQPQSTGDEHDILGKFTNLGDAPLSTVPTSPYAGSISGSSIASGSPSIGELHSRSGSIPGLSSPDQISRETIQSYIESTQTQALGPSQSEAEDLIYRSHGLLGLRSEGSIGIAQEPASAFGQGVIQPFPPTTTHAHGTSGFSRPMSLGHPASSALLIQSARPFSTLAVHQQFAPPMHSEFQAFPQSVPRSIQALAPPSDGMPINYEPSNSLHGRDFHTFWNVSRQEAFSPELETSFDNLAQLNTLNAKMDLRQFYQGIHGIQGQIREYNPLVAGPRRVSLPSVGQTEAPLGCNVPMHAPSQCSTPSLNYSPNIGASPQTSVPHIIAPTNAPGLANVPARPPPTLPSLYGHQESVIPEPSLKKLTSKRHTAKQRSKSRSVQGPLAVIASPTSPKSDTITPVTPLGDFTASELPLAVRVAGLPDDLQKMFRKGAGDRFCSKASKGKGKSQHTHTISDGDATSHDNSLEDAESERDNVAFLEGLYALLSSTELAEQTTIPDSLVEPLLKRVALPKAPTKKGSRGGAAGYCCLWWDCPKSLIKRMDHAKNHAREHIGSKPHTCGTPTTKGCGQTFLRYDDLKRHQKCHCSVLRGGPGRRPRSIRGVARTYSVATSETDHDGDSDESISQAGGDDDDYRPHASPGSSTTRELARELRTKRYAARHGRSSSLEDSGDDEDGDVHAGDFGHLQLQVSNIRHQK